MDSGTGSAQIRRECAEAMAERGIEIDAVTVTPAGKRRVVRITVARDLSSLPSEDHTSTVEPLTLDEVAQASRAANDALDASEVMGASAYTLEVSSPGVAQPLLTPTQFRRNVGRLLEVTDRDGVTVQERLVGAGPTGIHLGSIEHAPKSYQDIAKAVVQVEFSRPTTGE